MVSLYKDFIRHYCGYLAVLNMNPINAGPPKKKRLGICVEDKHDIRLIQIFFINSSHHLYLKSSVLGYFLNWKVNQMQQGLV